MLQNKIYTPNTSFNDDHATNAWEGCKNSSIKGCHGKNAIPLSVKFKHKKDVMESMGRMSKNQA